MRKILIILCFTAVITTFYSCKKFLDTQPEDFSSSVNYFQTEQHLLNSLTGVYDILGQNPLYGANYHSKLGMEADEGYYNRSNFTVGPQVYNITPGNTDILNFWNTLYKGIGRANFLLENVDNNKNISETYRLQVRGEALFLRAYYYFLLVQNFGGVPLMLKPTADANNIHVAKSTAKEVYEQILEDMELAENMVAPISELGYGGRVSKSAVRGILARVCLYMAGEPVKDISKYEKASYWAKKVMDDSDAGHKLNSDFSNVFFKYAADEYDYKESIWEVEFSRNSSELYTEGGYLGSWHGILCTNTEIGYSQGIMKGTRRLFDKYENGDLRRDQSLAPFVYRADGTKSLFTTTPNNLQKYDRYSGKYRREYEVRVPKNNNYTPINHPLLRYSDVLLMFAEAETQAVGYPTTEALEALNLVRQRAFGHFLPDADVDKLHDNDIADGLSKGFFMNIIRDERSRELCFEALRKPDLIRWGLLISTMKSVLADMLRDSPTGWMNLAFKNISERHLLFPIPAEEIGLNRKLVQNPGW